MTTQATCAERVHQSFRIECNDLENVFAVYYGQAEPEHEAEFMQQQGVDEITEDSGMEALCNYGLSIDYVTPGTFKGQSEGYLRWQISWGGPSTEWRFFYNPGDQYPYRIEYWFMDWFDGAKVNCTNDEIPRQLWEFLSQTDTPRNEFDKAMEDWYPEPEEEDEEESDDDDNE